MRLGFVLEVAIVLMGISPPAHAETTRVRITVDTLPRQDVPTRVPAKDAVLPNGARDGQPIPKTWPVRTSYDTPQEAARCTDGRRASVGTVTTDYTFTNKVWEANGKTFYDRTSIKIEDGKLHVTNAERLSVVAVADGLWGYRTANEVRLVFAQDLGMFARAAFFECVINERSVPLPAGAIAFESSPDEADGAMRDMFVAADIPLHRPPWTGVAFSALASVSKASADAGPMLNVIIKKP